MTSELNAWIGKAFTVKDDVIGSLVDRFHATIEIGQRRDDGIAPPGIHWCLGIGAEPTSEMDVDGNGYTGEIWPPISGLRLMWASTQISFKTPIGIGDKIERRNEIGSITEKSGRSGRLIFMTVKDQTLAGGQLAIEEVLTLVYREPETARAVLPEVNAAPPEGWDKVIKIVPDEKLLFRYSALTFNAHRIHYDQPYAETQESYPALIVHGPLMATLLLQIADQYGEILNFDFRGVAPAYCNQPLYLVSKVDEESSLILEAIGGDGRTCAQAKATVNYGAQNEA